MEFLLTLQDHNVKPLLAIAKLLATLLFHRGAYKVSLKLLLCQTKKIFFEPHQIQFHNSYV